MEWKDLAPWIAISITLAISILVPLFTQIANNNHQRKMQREKFKLEENNKRKKAFEDFLIDVGGLITARGYLEKKDLLQAGSSLHRLYIYAPSEWYSDLDKLIGYITKFEWDKARPLMQTLSRLISEELNKH